MQKIIQKYSIFINSVKFHLSFFFFGCMTKFCVLETSTKSYIEWFRTSTSSLKLIALAKYKKSHIINCLFLPFFLPFTNRWSELPKKRKDLKDRNANVYNLCSPSPKTKCFFISLKFVFGFPQISVETHVGFLEKNICNEEF